MDDVLTSLHVLDALYPYALVTFGVLLGLVVALETLGRPRPRLPRETDHNPAVRRTVLQ